MRQLELLAPAKNLELGTTAIDCGADSVYIAGPKFGAREKAGNSFKDIASLTSYAHRFGCKVYITINTILKENELNEAEEFIKIAWDSGCDAVIAQDMGILALNRPPIPIFASTQCDIKTPQKGKLLESLGFKRLILARELSLKQIKEISKSVAIPLESFVHGALCVCYSGQCYLSEYLSGRSANRGECAQPCRNYYSLFKKNFDNEELLVKNSPLLSPKDLNLSKRIEDLVWAGITSFKIEGRLKNKSYVKNIVSLYHNALNSFIKKHSEEFERSSWGDVKSNFSPNPNLTFNRGYTEYFIDGTPKEKLNSGVAKYIGEPIGKVINHKQSSSGGEFTYSMLEEAENVDKNATKITPITNGDGLCFKMKNSEIEGIRANNTTGNKVKYIGKLSESNLSGKTIYRNFNSIFEKELSFKTRREIDISLNVECTKGKIILTIVSPRFLEGFSGSFLIEGENPINKNKAQEIVENQLSKRSSIFHFKVNKADGDFLFYKTSSLNLIRNSFAEKISEHISSKFLQNRKRQASNYLATNKMKDLTNIAIDALSDYAKDGTSHHLTYLANCANSLSRKIFQSLGFGIDNYNPNIEYGEILMQSKYCIRRELGICLKMNDKKEAREELFLENNGRRLKLCFDCSRCIMFVKKS